MKNANLKKSPPHSSPDAHHPSSQAGFTFAELVFALLILVTGAVVLINHLAVNYLTTKTERDRVFAFSKAQAILSEIQTLVDSGGVEAAIDLDVLDDGVLTQTSLTIQEDSGGALVAPDHVVSGNYLRSNRWVWSRRITVQPFLGLNNRNVRYVTVRVFKRDDNGTEHAMADLSAVINSASSAYPTTQVFDVYLLAIENIPGWWVFMDSVKPFVESMITDLENRNPGLSFRTHWITKASFGRDETYRPFINEVDDSHNPITEVYHYPGRMPTGNASTYYYVPLDIQAHLNLDGEDWNGYDADTNPHPYALADFFNHGMRYPDELELWQQRVAAIEAREQDIRDAVLAGSPPPDELRDMSKEPTMRLFLEDLNTDPDKYENALVINLHGELLPMPALRNFSDAAKDPVNHPHWRVVTHPEELRTRNNDGGDTDDLRFRVYAYVDQPQFYPFNPSDPDTQRMSEPIVLEFMGLNLVDSSDPTELHSKVRLKMLRGGVMAGGTSAYDSSFRDAEHRDDASYPDEEMCYTAEFISTGEPRTRIYLYNTPLTCPYDGSSFRGLSNSERARLYGMEYCPSPVTLDSGEPSFDLHLGVAGSGPKNTARWTVELDKDVLDNGMFVAGNPSGDVVVEVRTRIASNLSGGGSDWQIGGTTFPILNQPNNLSKTYAWWTDDADDVPITERSQFHGDPRHLPYKDCFDGGDDFPNSYNWFHDSLNNNSENAAADFATINGTYLRNRWNGALWCDVPRYMQLLREGLVASSCVYTTLTGWSYYYMGIGNDIGYDSANGYPNSIPTDLTPHYGSGPGYVNTITGSRKCVLSYMSSYSDWWCGFPWLGELYPDELATTYLDTSSGAARGNLPAGSSVDMAFQYESNTAYSVSNRTAYGAEIHNNHQRTSSRGCGAFFNIGTSTTCFNHTSSSGNGTLTTVGDEISANYGMTLPTSAPVSRPFGMSMWGHGGEHWNYAPYTSRYVGTLAETYYTHSSGIGSGLVKLTDPTNSSAGYIVVNGIDRTVANGTTFIAKWAVLSLAHSYFESGDVSNPHRIRQTARVELQSPTDITELANPAIIEVQWGTSWTRWDGEPYTASGTFVEDEMMLRYVLMYSADNGSTYRYVQDGSIATPGALPTNGTYIISDTGSGDETYDWSVPSATFPEATYLLRVECYRAGAQSHYAWHTNRIFIQR